MEGETERTFEWVVQADEVLIPVRQINFQYQIAKTVQKEGSKIEEVKIKNV